MSKNQYEDHAKMFQQRPKEMQDGLSSLDRKLERRGLSQGAIEDAMVMWDKHMNNIGELFIKYHENQLPTTTILAMNQMVSKLKTPIENLTGAAESKEMSNEQLATLIKTTNQEMKKAFDDVGTLCYHTMEAEMIPDDRERASATISAVQKLSKLRPEDKFLGKLNADLQSVDPKKFSLTPEEATSLFNTINKVSYDPGISTELKNEYARDLQQELQPKIYKATSGKERTEKVHKLLEEVVNKHPESKELMELNDKFKRGKSATGKYRFSMNTKDAAEMIKFLEQAKQQDVDKEGVANIRKLTNKNLNMIRKIQSYFTKRREAKAQTKPELQFPRMVEVEQKIEIIPVPRPTPIEGVAMKASSVQPEKPVIQTAEVRTMGDDGKPMSAKERIAEKLKKDGVSHDDIKKMDAVVKSVRESQSNKPQGMSQGVGTTGQRKPTSKGR